MIRALVLAAGLTPLASLANAGDAEWSQAYRIVGQGNSVANGYSVGIHDTTAASTSLFTYYDSGADETREGLTIAIYTRTPGGWFRQQALNYFNVPRHNQVHGRIAMTADRIVACAPVVRRVVPLIRNAEGVWVDDPDAMFITGSNGTREAIIDAERTIIGHSDFDLGAGEVFFYNANWQFAQKFASPSPVAHGRFGWSLALDDDTLVIAEPGTLDESDEFRIPGKVHVYARDGNTFTHIQTLENPHPEPGALFGHSVSIDDDTLVIGSPLHNNVDAPRGAAYIYRRTANGQWALSSTVFAPDTYPAGPARFGWNVDIRDDRLAVSTWTTDGGVYIFHPAGDDAWTLQSAINTPIDPAPGFAMAAAADNIVFSAYSTAVGVIYIAPRTPECFRDLRGDANNDGVTDFRDLNQVLADYGLEGDDLPSDLSNDGIVDFIDLNFILFTFGSPCLPWS